jgi:hypothetical protein
VAAWPPVSGVDREGARRVEKAGALCQFPAASEALCSSGFSFRVVRINVPFRFRLLEPFVPNSCDLGRIRRRSKWLSATTGFDGQSATGGALILLACCPSPALGNAGQTSTHLAAYAGRKQASTIPFERRSRGTTWTETRRAAFGRPGVDFTRVSNGGTSLT